MKITPILALLFLSIFYIRTEGQSVNITEEVRSLDTYGFGKPDPVPILAENPKIFPYFKFDEYEQTSHKKDWKVVTLENDYIKVMVLPEIGGKVWGAIEKSTGKEFLYKNEVIKFRNIAMRGPWTSGGIEFNFGFIGHHPSTASPVNYLTRTNADGSVSCIVGSTDLPSNTTWTVEIRLEKDKAYFETDVAWYNASSLTESYYNWMNAAQPAKNDLEFFLPGNSYIGHNGNAHSWPIDDKGRNLAWYKNNDFEGSKSYHMVGSFDNFFGGYYHDCNFGFGHWSPYEEMPGQKLFLWALSRSGGIWEDLLTDSDGQYVEFQSGRLFNQYSPKNPISLTGFEPNAMDRWSEIWFPYKEIEGMVDASQDGVLNAEIKEGEIYIGLNALQKLEKKIQVMVNGKPVFSEKLDLLPMEIFSKTIPAVSSDSIVVFVEESELYYSNYAKAKELKRPFYSDKNLQITNAEQLFFEGLQALEYRDYKLAEKKLSTLIQMNPAHRDGQIKLAELIYRKADYDEALKHINFVLRMDTYNPGANYMAGITYRALNDTTNALESLGWAARDMKHRSASFAQMAEIYLAKRDYRNAATYAGKALDFNTYNLNARKVLVIASRKQGDRIKFEEETSRLLKVDPLNQLVQLERSFMNGRNPHLTLNDEFPAETILDLALQYRKFGLPDESLKILGLDTTAVKNKLWMAYLLRDADKGKSMDLMEEIMEDPVNFVYPYRRETLAVMGWAAGQNDNWKLRYYLAINHLAVGHSDKGLSILKSLNDEPDSDIFYRFRAKIFTDGSYESRVKDYQTALRINPDDWKVRDETIQFYLKNQKYPEAYQLSKTSYGKYPKIYNIALSYAKSLLNTGRVEKVLGVLDDIRILPYEQASEGREIYERAYVSIAKSYFEKGKYKKVLEVVNKSKEWPENIGVGKPYAPDEREQDYVLAMALQKVGENEESKAILNTIIAYTNDHINSNSLNHLYGLLALRKMGNAEAEDQLLAQLDEPTAIDDKRSQLAVAFFTESSQKLEQLKSQNVVPKDAQEIASWLVKQ